MLGYLNSSINKREIKKYKIKFRGETSQHFKIKTGVQQGDGNFSNFPLLYN